MAKFLFRLQPLLNLKMQLEDSLKNELGKAIRKLEEEKRILREIEWEREEHILQFNIMSAKGMVVEKFIEQGAYISLLKGRIRKQKENVNSVGKIVDNYREQLIKAVQEREMLEKLKERKFQDYLEEQLKEEQRLNDEFISYKRSC